jgi:hypothetical protein
VVRGQRGGNRRKRDATAGLNGDACLGFFGGIGERGDRDGHEGWLRRRCGCGVIGGIVDVAGSSRLRGGDLQDSTRLRTTSCSGERPGESLVWIRAGNQGQLGDEYGGLVGGQVCGSRETESEAAGDGDGNRGLLGRIRHACRRDCCCRVSRQDLWGSIVPVGVQRSARRWARCSGNAPTNAGVRFARAGHGGAECLHRAKFNGGVAGGKRHCQIAGYGRGGTRVFGGVCVAGGGDLYGRSGREIRGCAINTARGDRSDLRGTAGDAVDTPVHRFIWAVRNARAERECFS